MSRLAHHFATMAYNNAWSNHRLLGTVSRLTEAEFVAPRTSFFLSLKATLNHNVTVDWYYVDALERGLRDFCANEAELRAAVLGELGYTEAMIWGTQGPARPT